MCSRLSKHSLFLHQVASDKDALNIAKTGEIASIVEILFNISTLRFTTKDMKQLTDHIPHLHSISKTRSHSTAVRLIRTLPQSVLKIIIHSALVRYGLF